MRTDERCAAGELVAASLRDPCSERPLEVGRIPHVRLVAHDQLVAGEVGEFRSSVWSEVHDRFVPRLDERGARLDELLVPRVDAHRHAGAVPLLQQAVPLTQGPVVGGERTLLQRPERGHRLVEERAPLRWVADHDRQVEGAEQHRADLAAKVAFAPHGRPVHLHAARALHRDLDLHEHLAPTGLELTAGVRRVMALLHQRRVGGGPRRAEGVEHVHALEQVRLALPVRPDHHRQPIGQRIEVRVLVVAEPP